MNGIGNFNGKSKSLNAEARGRGGLGGSDDRRRRLVARHSGLAQGLKY
ncbi:MAG: hypothetical protein JST92_06890 [Deltaproteobacteria bacterium]|nr:hypothetical protein [Deltaproteobacteria bacterium]